MWAEIGEIGPRPGENLGFDLDPDTGYVMTEGGPRSASSGSPSRVGAAHELPNSSMSLKNLAALDGQDSVLREERYEAFLVCEVPAPGISGERISHRVVGLVLPADQFG